ncbi:hypothetical protein OH77DRAFT_1430109 [Trametes cingulata]|nr:hypothetical protein OH77DRAFT_1430109 [Trametes cingulata]
MSPSNAAESARILALYEQLLPNTCCTIAAVSLLVYDALLCLGREIPLVWGSAKRVASLLYISIRYAYIIWMTLPLFTLYPISDIRCTATFWALGIVAFLACSGPAVFASLRVYVLTGRNRLLCGVSLVLSFTPIIINLNSLYLYYTVNYPPPLNCSYGTNESAHLKLALALGSRVPQIVMDVLVMAVTWRATYKSARLLRATRQSLSLHQVMLQNGSSPRVRTAVT